MNLVASITSCIMVYWKLSSPVPVHHGVLEAVIAGEGSNGNVVYGGVTHESGFGRRPELLAFRAQLSRVGGSRWGWGLCAFPPSRDSRPVALLMMLWVYPQFRPHSDSGQIHSDSDQIPYRILIRMVFCTEIKSPALGMAPECRCAAPPRLCSGRASAQTLRGGQ
jgi:hypothetical protein